MSQVNPAEFRARLAALNKIKPGDWTFTNNNQVWAQTKNGTWLNARLSPVPKEGWTPEFQSIRAAEEKAFATRVAVEENPVARYVSAATRFTKPLRHGMGGGLDHFVAGKMSEGTSGAVSDDYKEAYNFGQAISRQEYDRAKQDFPAFSQNSETMGDAVLNYALSGQKLLASAVMSGITGFTKSAASSDKDWRDSSARAFADAATSAAIDAVTPKSLGKWGAAAWQAGAGNLTGQAYDKIGQATAGKTDDDDMAVWLTEDPIREIRYKDSGEVLRRDAPMARKHRPPPLIYKILEANDSPMQGKSLIEQFQRAYPAATGLQAAAESGGALNNPPLGPMSVVDGKVFLGGDPTDPRRWSELKYPEGTEYHTGGGF